MRFANNVSIFNYLAAVQLICNEKPDFVRLTVILAKTVKKANKSHSDGSGWYLCGIFAINRTVTDQAGIFAARTGFRSAARWARESHWKRMVLRKRIGFRLRWVMEHPRNH